MYKVWCEYDIGQDHVVFSTEELALTWAAQQLFNQDLSYDDALAANLLGVLGQEVDP